MKKIIYSETVTITGSIGHSTDSNVEGLPTKIRFHMPKFMAIDMDDANSLTTTYTSRIGNRILINFFLKN